MQSLIKNNREIANLTYSKSTREIQPLKKKIMSSGVREFTKAELEIYILIMCANADEIETEEELNMIKSKVDEETFNRIYAEFKEDSEDESLEKIQDNVNLHEFTNMELAQLRKEMYEIFFSDCDFKRMEKTLDRIMDNIIY